MSAKPWLKAKSAGEAFSLGFGPRGNGHDDGLRAVIEWHEARREKVSECWEVRSFKRGGVGQWVLATYSTRKDAMIRKHNECVAKDYAVHVVHVTRYRRAKR